MIAKIKSCPFCGAVCRPFETFNGGFIVIGDHDEKCVLRHLAWYEYFETPADATEAWNERTSEDL